MNLISRQFINSALKKMIDECTEQNDTGTVVGIAWPTKVDLFGCAYSVTDYGKATEAIIAAAKKRIRGIVSCHAAHAVVESTTSKTLGDMVNQFDLVAPDGQPVRWAMNLLHRTQLTDRVYGPELMIRLCQRAAVEDIPIYLYGGSPTIVEALSDNLMNRFNNLKIVGFESPPFRELTDAEDAEMITRINSSGAGIVFIGLGCPKQDIFAFHHRNQIEAIQVCVGAAFDFHACAKTTAPPWMQRNGLEWLFRLTQEPRRLWYRYLRTNCIFVVKLVWALCNIQRVVQQRRKNREFERSRDE